VRVLAHRAIIEEIQLARQQLAAMKAYRLKLQHEVVDLKAEVGTCSSRVVANSTVLLAAKVEIIKEQNQKLVTQEELLKQQAEALQKKQDELALQLAQFEQMKKDHQKKLDDQAFDASEGNRKKKATKASTCPAREIHFFRISRLHPPSPSH